MGRRSFRQRECLADQRAELLFTKPAVDVFRAFLLLVRRRIEHGETKERPVLRIERTKRKDWLRLPARHHDHSATECEQIKGALKVRLPLRFVPYMNALAVGELADRGIHISGFVIDDKIRT